MFELPTLNSLDAIDRQQVHYATIQLNGPKFPIDTADYFNLVIHRALQVVKRSLKAQKRSRHFS